MTVASARKKRPKFTSSQLLSIWIVVISGAFTLANTALDKISAFLLEAKDVQVAQQEQVPQVKGFDPQLKSAPQEANQELFQSAETPDESIDYFSTSSYAPEDLKDRFDTFISDIVELDLFFSISLALILMGLGNLAIDLLAPLFAKVFKIKRDEDEEKK